MINKINTEFKKMLYDGLTNCKKKPFFILKSVTNNPSGVAPPVALSILLLRVLHLFKSSAASLNGLFQIQQRLIYFETETFLTVFRE
jgi:hypothetical protein